ncbi:hypothetical protein ACFL3Q_02975 [Planctomycetota bacterium]
MKKENNGISKAWFAMIMMIVFLILPANSGFALDIYMIIIWDTEYREDGSPLESFEFAAGVTGDDITQVTITPPGGTPIALNSSPSDPLFWGFSDEAYDTLAALRTGYPSGNYIFTFNGGEDSVTVNHNPTIPTGFANITYPANGAINVPLNPIFTWDSSISYGDALNTAVAEEDMEGQISTQFLVNISQTSWAVGPLNPGILHWLEVAVFAGTESQPYILQTADEDFFEYYDLFENCNIVFFTTAGPVVDDNIDIDMLGISTTKQFRDGEPQGDLPWSLDIMVSVIDPDNLHHIDITKPGDSDPFITLYEEGTPVGWWGGSLDDDYASLSALRVVYPEGIYRFDFRAIDNSLIRSLDIDYTDLPGEPMEPVDFIYPSTNGQTDISINPTFTWSVSPDAGDALMMAIDNDEVVYFDAPVPISSTSWTPGPLLAEHQYELDVFVINIKDWTGEPGFPTMTDSTGDTFSYTHMIEYLNEIVFITLSSDDPIDEIEEILDFVDDSVEDGTLTGDGPGKSAGNRLNALINMLEEAQSLIEAGLYEEACDQLWSAYRKCDGVARPPDFVTGDAADDLAVMILLMMDELGC